MNIELDDVSVVYSQWGTSRTALRNVSLKIPSGTLVWITGPNGSGKSTLLAAIAGEVAVSAGRVRIGSALVDTKAPPYQQVFLVPQNPMRGTVGTLSVFEHMLLAEPHGTKRRAARDCARALMRAFAFDVNLDQRVDSLSGGQRQMLSLLLALKRLPPVILLDEPTAALDAAHTTQAKRIIKEMCTRDRTVLIVSHGDFLDGETSPQCLMLEDGRVSPSAVDARSDRAPAGSAQRDTYGHEFSR